MIQITTNQLNSIIEEEINNLIFEDKKSCRGNAIHSTTGKFIDKDRAKGSYAIEDIPADCDRARTQATRKRKQGTPGTPREPCGRKDSSRKRKCRGVTEQEDGEQLATTPVEPPQTSLEPLPLLAKGLSPSTGLVGRLNNMKGTLGKLGLSVDEMKELLEVIGLALANELDNRRV